MFKMSIMYHQGILIMNYKYTIFNLSYVIILGKYLLVLGFGDIGVKYIKHVFMKFVCVPPVSWLYLSL